MVDRIDADREEMLIQARLEEKRLMRPMCEYCGNHITDDHYYLIPIRSQTLTICENCLDDYMVWIDQDKGMTANNI